MRVLIDTSVWIRALTNRAPYAVGLRWLLNTESACGHELVFGELLVGDSGRRKELLENYLDLPWAETVPHREVVELVRAKHLHGRGLSWIDTHILASARIGQMLVWSADEHLVAAATELGVSYTPRAFDPVT